MKSNFKVMYFFELLVTCLWIPFFHYFFKFYREGLEFGSEEYSSAIKLSFILIYRSEQMILFLSIAFGLLTINLFITVVFYFFMKNIMYMFDNSFFLVKFFCFIIFNLLNSKELKLN